tara:strand:- start:32196 stop:32639 length:444 start_codon:yes stop_codon:yes gene_type:complete
MAFITNAGTVLAMVAGVPATYDAVGFAALTFVPVSEVETLPAYGGTSQEITFTALDDAIVNKRKGSFDPGSISISLGRDVSDAGQTLMQAAGVHTNNAEQSFSVTFSDASVHYFTGLVMGFDTIPNDANSVVKSAPNVALTNVVVEA